MSKAAKPDDRIEELFIDLPTPAVELGAVFHFRDSGRLGWIGSALPICDGRITHSGRVGVDIRLDQGQLAARNALVQALGILKQELGSLNKVKQIIKMTGYIAASETFCDHHKVLAQASALLVDIFGPAGKHTRTAVGAISLPQGASVMLELLVEL